MALYQFFHLTKAFGDSEILKDISFHLAEGERVGLVGVNGCGKSTLLRILAGLEHPDSGDIRLPKRSTVSILQQETVPGEESLSGGEKTWMALTRILAEQSSLMLMDEPTSNLDFQAIQTAIKLLQDCAGSMIIVSHDRYFLDNLVTRILEIEDGRIVEYSGNYTDYRLEKQKRRDERLSRYKDAQKEQQRITETINKTRQWAEKSHRDSTKPESGTPKMGLKEKKRAKAMKIAKKAKNDIRRLERLIDNSETKPTPESRIRFKIGGESQHGRRVLEVRGLSKSYDATPLIKPSSFYIMRNEKVAIFGPNGCGKTTLIRMIQGLEKADDGQLWLSSNFEPCVLSQSTDQLPSGQSVMAWLIDRMGKLDGLDRARLAQLGFTPRHLQQDIGSISLGEQMKLKLAEPILTNREFLILDEPTNYLDIHARETLEDALSNYAGTLLIVSHDLYLLKKICTKVLLFDHGQIRRLEETFDAFIQNNLHI